MKNYSQIGQDLFVQKLIGSTGYFVEIGGYLPIEINNTYLLELSGWEGISLDIIDYTEKWKVRKTPLLVEDALTCDFNSIFDLYDAPEVIDYLSVDVEKEGERYKSLLNCWKANKNYKIITIEHDAHIGYSEKVGMLLMCYANTMTSYEMWNAIWLAVFYIFEMKNGVDKKKVCIQRHTKQFEQLFLRFELQNG